MEQEQKKCRAGLDGKVFEVLEQDRVIMAGAVISQVHEGYFLAQLYDLDTGDFSFQKIFNIADVSEWRFYESMADMEAADAVRMEDKRPGLKR